ncbi:MAG: hypothetical protein ACTIOI_16960, partial [Pseudomonas helleri]|uniref:hypothetical protein n=1 Tax=Pseudomonas helleri TaxID=1608996 RepID=UPI003F96A392
MSTVPLTNTSLKPPDLKDLGIHHDLIKAKAQSAINNFHASLLPALHNQTWRRQKLSATPDLSGTVLP